MTALSITWAARPEPLVAVGVIGGGPVARALAAATARALTLGAELRACAGAGWLVVLGRPDELPWVDGATYLGSEAGALVPTALRPSPPASFLLRVLGDAVPLTVLLPGHVLRSAAPLRVADPARMLERVG